MLPCPATMRKLSPACAKRSRPKTLNEPVLKLTRSGEPSTGRRRHCWDSSRKAEGRRIADCRLTIDDCSEPGRRDSQLETAFDGRVSTFELRPAGNRQSTISNWQFFA